MGANGAGKTAALRPLVFIASFIKDSFLSPVESEIEGFHPHFDYPDDPTEIEVQGEDREGTIWRYRLRATRQLVLEESLQKKGERYFSTLFDRRWDPESRTYVIKQRGFGMPPREAAKVRQNASLISTAAQYGVEAALHLTTRLRVVHNVELYGRKYVSFHGIEKAAAVLAADDVLALRVSDLLRSWDLGLSGVAIKELERTDSSTGQKVKVWVPIGLHQKSDGGTHPLFLIEESSGTQSAFFVLSHVLPVLEYGGLAVIDELDGDLHPHMLEPLLDLFASPTTNPLNAQLVFTCHSPDVLVALQKSQVHLVEKSSCASEIYRADSIAGLRADDNLRAKYMAGALGAVPQI